MKIGKSLLVILALAVPLFALNTVSKSFTATGNSPYLLVRPNETLTYSVSGTFAGVVQIQKSVNGVSWETVVADVSSTASGTLVNSGVAGKNSRYRVSCSSYTSGTIVTSLTEGSDVFQNFSSPGGERVLELLDDGAKAKALKVWGQGTTNVVDVSTQTAGTVKAFQVENDGDVVIGSTPTVKVQMLGGFMLPSNPAPRTNVTPPGIYTLIVNTGSSPAQTCISTGTLKSQWALLTNYSTACSN